MSPKRVAACCVLLTLLGACGKPAPTRPQVPALAPSQSASGASLPQTPCEIARPHRARVAGLRAQGRLGRALRVILRADELCPEEEARSSAERLALLVELGLGEEAQLLADRLEARADLTPAIRAAAVVARKQVEADSHVNVGGMALVDAGLAAIAAGKAAEAQRAFDRAIVALEKQTNTSVRADVPRPWRGWAHALAWSPRGDSLAVTHGKSISVLDAESCRERMRLEGHPGHVYSVAFSPDGKLIASGSADGGPSLEVWACPGGGHCANPNPAPRQPATVQVWDAATGFPLAKLEGKPREQLAVAFAPDGATLAVLEPDTLRLWEVQNRAEKPRLPVPFSMTAIAYAPDGKRLAVNNNGELRFLDPRTGQEQLEVKCAPSALLTMAFSPDGSLFAAGTHEQLWVRDGRSLRQLYRLDDYRGMHHGVTFSPDGSTLALSAEQQGYSIRLVEAPTGKELRRFGDVPWTVTALAFSPDGKRLASGDVVGAFVSREVATGKQLCHLEDPGFREAKLSPGLGRLATQEGTDRVAVRDLPTGRTLHRFKGEFVAFSADGSRVVLRDGKSHKVFDVASGREVGSLSDAGVVGVSRDGKLAVGRSGDGHLRIWDVTRRLVLTDLGIGDGVVAFSADSRLIAMRAPDARLVVREAATGAILHRLELMTNTPFALAFSPDGSAVAATEGHALKLRKVGSGKAYLTVKLEFERAATLAWLERGLYLTSHPDNSSTAIWQASDTGLVRLAAVSSTRDLDAFYVFTPDGYFDIQGKDARRLESAPICRIGQYRAELALCRERFLVPGLLDKVLAGAAGFDL